MKGFMQERSTMKYILLLFFVGCGIATAENVVKRSSDFAVMSFIEGMDQATPLYEALGVEKSELVDRLERDTKEELAEYLKDLFKEVLSKINGAVLSGKEINKEALEKLKQLKEQMEDLQIEDHEIHDFREKIEDHLRQILEKMGIFDDETVQFAEPMEAVLGDLSFRNLFLKLKQMILEKMDVPSLRLSITKVVGQGSQALCEWLTNKGKEKLLNFFDRIIDSQESKKRSVSELYEEIKEYVDKMDTEYREKLAKFGDWMKELMEKGLYKSKTEIDMVSNIAKELLKESSSMSRDTAHTAISFLQKYKDHLGDVYERVIEKLQQRTSKTF